MTLLCDICSWYLILRLVSSSGRKFSKNSYKISYYLCCAGVRKPVSLIERSCFIFCWLTHEPTHGAFWADAVSCLTCFNEFLAQSPIGIEADWEILARVQWGFCFAVLLWLISVTTSLRVPLAYATKRSTNWSTPLPWRSSLLVKSANKEPLLMETQFPSIPAGKEVTVCFVYIQSVLGGLVSSYIPPRVSTLQSNDGNV